MSSLVEIRKAWFEYEDERISKALHVSGLSHARLKELEEASFQRGMKSRAAASKPGFVPHPQSQAAKQQRYQQMLTRTTGVGEQQRWGGSR